MSDQDKRCCMAHHSHAEWPRTGQCTEPATKIDATDPDESVLSCDLHAERNPWRPWAPYGVAPVGCFVSWGHWGIGFWAGDRNAQDTWQAIAEISFPVGPCGPMDGFLGSPERQAYQRACAAWTERGELPEGARCPIDSAWLYDPEHPNARWIDCKGWQSAVRVGGRWVFPEVTA